MKKYLYTCLVFSFLFSISLNSQNDRAYRFEEEQNSCLDEEYFYEFERKYEIKAPIRNLEIPAKTVRVEAENGMTFRPNPGTTVRIPENAFLDSNGEPIKGTVDVHYRDFKNPLDIFLSGIPMTVSTQNGTVPMQSAGMFELTASQKGREVFPNPNAPISVEMASLQVGEEYDLYELNELDGTWQNQGQNNLKIEPIKPPENQNQIAYRSTPMPKNPAVVYQYLNIYTLSNTTKPARNPNIRGLQFVIKTTKTNFTEAIKDSLRLTKGFQELYESNNMIWVYDGPDKAEMSRKIRAAFTSKSNTKVKGILKEVITEKKAMVREIVPKNIIIEPNYEQDNYMITVSCNRDTFTIPAYPYFQTSSPEIEQKRNEKFYKSYSAVYQKRLNEWERFEAVHTFQKEIFDGKMEAYQNELAENLAWKALQRQDERWSLNPSVKRTVRVETFGILNIDKLMPLMEPEQILAVQDTDNQPIKLKSVHLLDRTNNAVLSWLTNLIRYDRLAENSVIVATEDGKIGMISPEVFALAVNEKKGKTISIQTEFRDAELISKSQMSEALAMN